MRIEDIGVEDPCCESWDEMEGDDVWRHCAACDKDVVNLSELTRLEASQLVLDTESLCVRFRRDSTGNVIFRDIQLGRQRRGARELVAVALCVAPFVLWTALVSPLNEDVSWSGEERDIFAKDEMVVQGGISFARERASNGYDYDQLRAKPQAVVFIDEDGTPRLDKHALPVGQERSDGIPRLVVP